MARKSSREQTRRVVVIGSANMDFVFRVSRLPRAGETVIGGVRGSSLGGKGANQAVAAARAGAAVAFVGAVGEDEEGEKCRQGLERAGVDATFLESIPGESTGAAAIVVDGSGENQIAVASGANAKLSGSVVGNALERLRLGSGDVCLLGFEVPACAVDTAARLSRATGALVVVNPAPPRALSGEVLASRPILTPNALEASALSGVDEPSEAIERLTAWTKAAVLVTLGAKGALIGGVGALRALPAPKVRATDTTGAGDVFSGVLCAGLAEGLDVVGAAERAIVAAALSVTAPGARSSPSPSAADPAASSGLSGGEGSFTRVEQVVAK